MSITFNADEIFEMAVEIERNGDRFYRDASEKATDDSVRRMLLDMSAMEKEHLAIFEQMRKELRDEHKEATTFDPDNEGVLYLQAMADARGMEGRKSPTEELSGEESLKEIIEIALEAEKESVVFYSGVRSLVPAGKNREKVDEIIKEELSHIRFLLGQLKLVQ